MTEEDDTRESEQEVASLVVDGWFVLVAVSNGDIGDVSVMVLSVCMVACGRQ